MSPPNVTDRSSNKIALVTGDNQNLVHSAGIVRGRYELTDEGIESNFAMLDPFLAQTTEEAAGAALLLLSAKEFEGVTGARFLKIKKFRLLTSPISLDPAESERLWELSESLLAKAQPGAARFLHTKQN